MSKAPSSRTTAQAYRPELDVLRFAAFALVFVHHVLPRGPRDCPDWLGSQARVVLVTFANMCGYGLSLFFLLSAFLITDLLLREKALAGDVSIRRFYVRRVLRIWPLYFLAIALGLGLQLLVPSGRDLIMLGLYALMVGNWFFSFAGWTDNPTTPLWSISIEEQFYLFWPAVMKYLDRRGQYAVCGGLVAIAFVVEIVLGRAHAAIDTTIWTNSFVQFETFAAGAALALALERRTTAFATSKRMALALLGSFLWLVAVFGFSAKALGGAQSATSVVAGTACAVAGSLAIMLSVLDLRVRADSRWVYLGKISFGLYVFHMFFIELAKLVSVCLDGLVSHSLTLFPLMVLSLFPTIAAAHWSYQNFESRFLRLKERFTIVPSRPVDETSDAPPPHIARPRLFPEGLARSTLS